MGRPKGSKNKKGSTNITIKCLICDVSFIIPNYRKTLAKYCSHKCYSIAMKETYHGPKCSHWKGGECKKKNGYVYVYNLSHPHKDSRGYVRKHRLVMEKHIGRYLFPTEVVHHINEIRDDNRIENLMLFPNNSAHTSFHSLS